MGGELRRYDVEINGVKTQMKLNEEDAERLGGTSVTSGPTPAGKKVAASSIASGDAASGASPAGDTETKRSPSPRNKARTPRNKTVQDES